MRARLAAIGVAVSVSCTGPQAQPGGGRVVLAYRDLLRGGDAVRTMSSSREADCGVSNGPFTLLSPETPAAAAADIARRIDAAGVPALVDRALARARAALPGADVTICVFAGENVGGLPYLGGVGGVAIGGGRIRLFLHPAPNRLGRVEYTVAHEYHHEAERLLGPTPRFGPLNQVVREGKADVFALSLYPQWRPGHTEPLSDAELRDAWQALMRYEADPAGFGSAFMIGRFPDGPRWPGYRLGFELVDGYVRAQPGAPTAWIRTPARQMAEAFRQTPRGIIASR